MHPPVQPHYQLKQGRYCLYDLSEAPSAVTGERRCRLSTDAVALAFDALTGEVHKHGCPKVIHLWAGARRRQLRAAGALPEANRIVVISGPLPVDEINRCLGSAGHSLRLLRRLATLPHGKFGCAPTPPPRARAHPAGTRPSPASSRAGSAGSRSGFAFA